MNYSVPEKNDTPQIPMNKGAMDLSNVWRLTVGAGNSVLKISNGKLWAGSTSYESGVFQLDLATGALVTTGTINATSGVFSGNINVTSGGVFSFLADDGTTLLAKLYSYIVSGGASKSVGLDANSSSGEVKLSLATKTGLVVKNLGGKPGVEFYNVQRIYTDEATKLKFDSSLLPYSNDGADLGSSSKVWSRLYTKSGVTCDGSNGIGDSFGYTDDNGNKKKLTFKGGILTDQGNA